MVYIIAVIANFKVLSPPEVPGVELDSNVLLREGF